MPMLTVEQIAALTPEQARQALEQAMAENTALRSKSRQTLTIRVSDKGAVSVYGLMRFPVTLYGASWLKLLAIADDIKAFIQANRDSLTWK